MAANHCSRPSLELNMDYHNAAGYPRSAFQTHRSPITVSTPLTAKPLPSPLYPRTPGHDVTRGMVDLLDSRGRHGSLSNGDRSQDKPLSSISEQSTALRGERGTVSSLLSPRTKPLPVLPLTTPTTPILPSPSMQRRPDIASETRSMLLSGISCSQAADLGTVVSRRQSVLAEEIQRHHATRRHSQIPSPIELQTWGHIYLNDASNADVLVAPAAIRRASTELSEDGPESKSDSNRLMLRARIRPRAKERKPFIIQRNFNLNELRAIIPSTTPAPQRRPSEASNSSRTATSPLAPRRRRSSAATSSGTLSPRVAGSRGAEVSHHPSNKEIPFHLAYARTYLPVLAALMLSGHLREGDSIDLPMPHPEAWSRTVAYVYTGHGELTEAMKQNITHLGGKVD